MSDHHDDNERDERRFYAMAQLVLTHQPSYRGNLTE